MAELKIFILEDDPLIAESIRMNLEELGYVALEPASTKQEALKQLQSERPDFAILDINIEGRQEGIEVGEFINKNLDIPFIYLTGNSDKDSIDKASKTHPQSYLIKPFSPNDLYSAIQIAISNFKAKNKNAKIAEEINVLPESIFIKVGNKYVKVQLHDVCYLKSDDKYIEIITLAGNYSVRTTMESMLASLKDHNFLRVHRSYSINMRHLKEVNGEYLTVFDAKIPVGRVFRDDLLKIISTFQ
ncbi:MAG: response regulator [Bacteroidia bacterium]|nr:response regulator [Bacteroidia bacterium]